jgi:hypothetical protein
MTTRQPIFRRLWATWIFTAIICFYLCQVILRQTAQKPGAARAISDRLYRLAVLPGSADGAETDYHAHMKAVLQGCNDICRVDMRGEPSLYFDYIQKEVDCHALMTNAAIDAPMADATPPEKIPAEMVDAFTYGGKVELIPYFGGILNQRYMGNQVCPNR